MRKQREALLIAALAGLVIVGAAAFVVQPTLAGPAAATQHVALGPSKLG
ncbi:MAG TPA: hypothetical protein VL418_17495 [Devosiaceae bacterium]|nr:hypothetical protein [Devosiaceae bacterium]